MGEWREVPFSEAVLINPPVRLKNGKSYPFVDMASIEPSSKLVSAKEERSFTGGGSRFQSGDTLMARITPCLENGKIGQFYSDNPFTTAHGSTEFIVVRGRPNVSETEFAYYLTKWEYVRSYAISHMTGTSGRQRVPANVFDQLPVPLPSVKEQRAIASTLGSLDDKIDLNRRMNETLEAMARAIFKDWFVDFGPVRAKAEGRPPYLAPDLWALFPDALDDDDKPVGWRTGTLGDCFHLTMGQSPPGNTYNDKGDGLPFFQGRTDFGFRYPENRMFCTAPTRVAKQDDTLISVRAPVGDINMALGKCCIGRGVAALRHKSSSISFTYYSAWAIQKEIQQYEHTGTVFGSINKAQFEALKTINPQSQIVNLFDKYAGPIDRRIRANILESQTLAQLRDFLLPKLMSGEIRLRDAEKAVKQVT